MEEIIKMLVHNQVLLMTILKNQLNLSEDETIELNKRLSENVKKQYKERKENEKI